MELATAVESAYAGCQTKKTADQWTRQIVVPENPLRALHRHLQCLKKVDKPVYYSGNFRKGVKVTRVRLDRPDPQLDLMLRLEDGRNGSQFMDTPATIWFYNCTIYRDLDDKPAPVSALAFVDDDATTTHMITTAGNGVDVDYDLRFLTACQVRDWTRYQKARR